MTSTATPRNEFHPRGQPEFHDQHGLHRRISLKKHLARERLIVGMGRIPFAQWRTLPSKREPCKIFHYMADF